MAEFCPECWNKMNGFDEMENRYQVSAELNLCEGCGEWKRVVIKPRRGFSYRQRRIRLKTT